jgi:hypothetical protein
MKKYEPPRTLPKVGAVVWSLAFGFQAGGGHWATAAVALIGAIWSACSYYGVFDDGF